MGYYTRFSLKWEPIGKVTHVPTCSHSKPKDAKYCPECGKSTKMVDLSDRITEYLDKNDYYGFNEFGECEESCKWYDHESDMKILSSKFPTYLFTLRGEGEESGDIWIKYFLDSDMQVCQAKISFGECTLIDKKSGE